MLNHLKDLGSDSHQVDSEFQMFDPRELVSLLTPNDLCVEYVWIDELGTGNEI